MPCARTNQKSNSTLNTFEKETTVLHVTTKLEIRNLIDLFMKL